MDLQHADSAAYRRDDEVLTVTRNGQRRYHSSINAAVQYAYKHPNVEHISWIDPVTLERLGMVKGSEGIWIPTKEPNTTNE
jgi:hypothetical protein